MTDDDATTGKLSPNVAKLKLQFRAFSDAGLSSTDKLVLAALITFHNGLTGQLNPSAATIAGRASVKRRTVLRTMPRLVRAGYVAVTQRPLKRGHLTNAYTLAGVYARHECATSAAPVPDQCGTGTVPAQRHRGGDTESLGGDTESLPGGDTESHKHTELNELADNNSGALKERHNSEPSSNSRESTTSTEATGNDGARGQKGCIQGGDGGKAQAQRQHRAGRDGAASTKAVPQRMLRVFSKVDGGKPKRKHVLLDGYVDLLGGGVKAWTYLSNTLDAIADKHDCTTEEARRLFRDKAIGARSGRDLRRRLDAFGQVAAGSAG